MMRTTVDIGGVRYQIDLDRPHSIHLSLDPGLSGPSCFASGRPIARPVRYGDQEITVAAGAPVNFYRFEVIPHGHGTHTECIGHITSEMQRMADLRLPHFLVADVLSVAPEHIDGDEVITAAQLSASLCNDGQALILRTLPNSASKRTADYTDTNPAYLHHEATRAIIDAGYDHLLLDLPSVDKEQDGGALASHRAFWGLDTDAVAGHRTITEMIYVPDHLDDGRYLLHIGLSGLPLDAVPSTPVIYDCTCLT